MAWLAESVRVSVQLWPELGVGRPARPKVWPIVAEPLVSRSIANEPKKASAPSIVNDPPDPTVA